MSIPAYPQPTKSKSESESESESEESETPKHEVSTVSLDASQGGNRLHLNQNKISLWLER